jgi:hypothetical protein
MKRTASLLLAFLSSSAALAEDGAFGVTTKFGTLGFGVELSRSFLGSGEARVAFNHFDYDYDDVASDIDYAMDLGLKSTTLMLGWHPGRTSFRIGGGMLVNGTDVAAVGKPSGSYQIGDTIYDGDDVGTLDARLDFERFVPMAGIGWDGSFVGRRLGVALDLGVVFHGDADIVMQASGPIASDPEFMSDLAQETAEMQEDLDRFDVYPMASVGLSFRF